MPDALSVFAGGVVGYALSRLQDRRARKRSLGKALYDLLHLRRQLVVDPETLIAEHADLLRVPDDDADIQELKATMDKYLVGLVLPTLESAAADIAGDDPVLAEDLRSIGRFPQVRVAVEKFAVQLLSARPDLTDEHGLRLQVLMKLYSEAVLTVLDARILSLGWRHGIVTWWRVRDALRWGEYTPAEREAFDHFQRRLAAPSPPVTPAVTPAGCDSTEQHGT